MTIQAVVSGNSVTVVDEALRAYEGQTVTLDVFPAVNANIRDTNQTMAALDALCHAGKHVWTEDPADYIRRMRDDDRL
jgi:hypothetical protein